jgi:adenosylcobinamide hydrolase
VRQPTTAGPEVVSLPDGPALVPALVWRWAEPMRCISTSPLGGGLGTRAWALNAEVPSSYARRDPETHLRELACSARLRGDGVGMLTAASVGDFRLGDDDGVQVVATVGLGHPVLAACSDDETRADGENSEVTAAATATGTINVLALVPERLSDAALVNAVSTVTEAKVQALHEAGFVATGTATDAVCVACPSRGAVSTFGGTRSHWGSRLARAAHSAVLGGAVSWKVSEREAIS